MKSKSELVAEYTGELRIGDCVIPCAVLGDGRRVLSETGISESLGSRTGGAKRTKKEAIERGEAPMPIFVASKRLKPFIDSDLEEGLTTPVVYRHGSTEVRGFEASLLPQICDVWLKARDAGVLQPQQLARAKKAEIIIRGLAHVAIIALVDEATGYQDVRAKNALAEILEKFLDKEIHKWTKTFPDEFYKEIFRLRGWEYTHTQMMRPKRPSIIGKWTNDFVYERLAPGVLAELEKVNPKNDEGNRLNRHHQWFNTEFGHPKLKEHIAGVLALLRAAGSWGNFKNMLDRSFPKLGDQYRLPIDD